MTHGDPSQLQRWRGPFKDQIPPEIRAIRGDRVDSDLSCRLERELIERTSHTFATKFCQACPFPGATPDDYKQREITLPGGHHAIVGIRVHYFEKHPFVDVVASTLPVQPESLRVLYDAALDAYPVFEPSILRIIAGPDPLNTPDLDLRLDQLIVAGPTNVEAPAQLVAHPVDNAEDAAEFVRSEYETFFLEHPSFESIIAPADASSIQNCIDTGLAAWIRNGSRTIGFIASREKVGALTGGQSISEEILVQNSRGRGLGAPAQRAFIHALHQHRGPNLIWGTIDARNHASRITARRAGRTEIAAWQWVQKSSRAAE